jgi:ornithine cyclodeaminase/alanine dehydrogenase-like protein (mu-crystallin family)
MRTTAPHGERMAVMLGYSALAGVLGMRDAIDLLEGALRHEAAGRTAVSQKYVTNFEGGSLRMLVAADYAAGYCATKAYNTTEGVGTRYVVSLYRLSDGELLALLDGQLITDLRTGAASGVIARRVPIDGPVTLGLVGSGHQAAMQLEALASVYPLAAVSAYSPTERNRVAFSKGMSERLGIPVKPAQSVEAAVRGHKVVASASGSRSSEPVLRGAWLGDCRLLCAVGNTRPYAAEADLECFRSSALLAVDSLHALEEAGELREAVKQGVVHAGNRTTLAEVVAGRTALPAQGRIAFKSVGTALQDLALAVRYYELAGRDPALHAEPELASLRRPVAEKFSAPARGRSHKTT